MLKLLVLGLGVTVVALPGAGWAAEGMAAVAVPVDDGGWDAFIAALDVTDPVVADGLAGSALVDENTAEVTADTGVVTPAGFTAQIDIRDDLGLLVTTEFAQVAPNGTLQFTVSPTVLLLPSTNFTLQVLRHDPATDLISVSAALNLAPLVLATADSVTHSTAQTIATGNLSSIQNLLAIAAETGGLSAADVAALQAAAARIIATSAGAALRQSMIAAAQRAGQYSLQNVARGSTAFRNATAAITKAVFDYGFQPVANAFTIAALRSYIAAALVNIKLYQDRIAANPNSPPEVVAIWQRQINLQNARISQIMAWMQANNVNP